MTFFGGWLMSWLIPCCGISTNGIPGQKRMRLSTGERLACGHRQQPPACAHSPLAPMVAHLLEANHRWAKWAKPIYLVLIPCIPRNDVGWLSPHDAAITEVNFCVWTWAGTNFPKPQLKTRHTFHLHVGITFFPWLQPKTQQLWKLNWLVESAIPVMSLMIIKQSVATCSLHWNLKKNSFCLTYRPTWYPILHDTPMITTTGDNSHTSPTIATAAPRQAGQRGQRRRPWHAERKQGWNGEPLGLVCNHGFSWQLIINQLMRPMVNNGYANWINNVFHL